VSDLVAITGIAAGGDGVGRLPEGRAVFVSRTAPGDRVRVRDVKLRKNFAHATLHEVVTPSGARVTAPCGHYQQDHCGGCQLQHLSYDAQLAAKRAIVGDALRRIGKLDVADPEIVEAVDEWRYRAKISLAVKQVGRTDPKGLPDGRGRTVGLHPYDRPGSLFSLMDCHITDFRLMALWRDLKQHLDLLPPRCTRLTLRLDREGCRHVLAESSGEPWRDAGRLRAALPEGEHVVCWWQPVDGAARVVAGPETGYPATAFEQVNPEMGALARRWGVEQLGDLRGCTVWDLYGGIGDTASLLAGRAALVVSVDVDEKAIEWARRRGVGDGHSVRFIAAKVEDVLPSLPEAHAVVCNPPRGGLHWDVTLRLTGQPVPRLAYISGDPATLARDLHRLGVNYRLVAVRAFDLFPQTAHVETVAVLEAA